MILTPLTLLRCRATRIALVLTTQWLMQFHGTAQTPQLLFDRFSTEQGLSQSIVTSILQDRRGFLWFATEDGLNLYDGYSFTILRSDPADTHSLSYNHVTTVFEDRSGTIWVGTFGQGLNRYVLKKNRFLRYLSSVADPTSLSNGLVNAIAQDRTGSLWIGTQRGLNKLVPETDSSGSPRFVRYMHDPADPKTIGGDVIRSVCVDRVGTLWIGTDDGLSCLTEEEARKEAPTFRRYRHVQGDGQGLSHDTVRTVYVDREGTLWAGTDGGLNECILGAAPGEIQSIRPYRNTPGDPRSLSNNQVYAVLRDDAGTLWVGTNGGGLNRFEGPAAGFSKYRFDPQDVSSLSYDEIRFIFQDRSGLLWVGTYGGGVNKVDARRKQFVHYRPEPARPGGLNQGIVWSIFQDREGILWAGTHGGGLNRLDRTSGRFTYYRADPGDPRSLSHDIVRLVIGDPSGELWIGTHGGGICRFNPATGRFVRYLHDPRDSLSLSGDEIRSLFLDDDGTVWVGTHGSGLSILKNPRHGRPRFVRYRNDPANPRSLGNDYVRAIYKDRTGVYWIGTLGGGLSRFDPATGTFSAYRADPRNPRSLNSDHVMCVHEDREGILWLGTWGGGLSRFDKAAGSFQAFTHREGLPSDAIYGILEDRHGNLWLSSNEGLCRFDPGTRRVKTYTMRDGLQSDEFNGGSFFQNSRGEMFFGGINGFNVFHPDSIHDNPYVPPIVITSFRKLNKEIRFDRPLSEVEEIALSHRDYFFSFEFAALDYTAPEKNQYAYKMEGLDDDWIPATSKNRVAQYTTLRPGSYTFRVKGSNNDGVWNEAGTSVGLTIRPPYWETWPFRIGILAAVAAIVTGLYLRRLKNVRLKAELRTAHEAQMSIMPQTDPVVEGLDISGVCVPANEVGGDFFDYLWLEGETPRFHIVVGDVSGKAMKAAMMAVMASGIVNAEARSGASIGKILSRTNQLLFPKIDRRMFTALCLVGLNPGSRELVFANAGLNKPLLKSDHQFLALEAVGSTYPLGMVSGHQYSERSVPLKQGDVLILQTDGLTEAQNHARQLYGEERLEKVLASLDTGRRTAREIRDAVLQDVRAFTGSAPQFDDMTMIVVKIL